MGLQLELSRRAFLALAVLITLILGGLIVVIYLPKATISLEPAAATKTVEQDITLSTTATAPDFVKFTLPAKVTEKELEDSTTITRSEGEVHEDFAKGVVTLVNEQDEEQPLLPKTHLLHEASGTQFLTDAAVRIPPQGEIQIAVTAKVQGPAGNVPPGNFIVEKLPESAQKVIYGKSEQEFTGGIATSSTITEAEILSAKSALTEQLRDRAAAELTLAAGGAPIPPELIYIDTLSEEASAEPGSAAVSFSVRSKIRARALVVDQNDLLSLTLIALRGSASSEEEFVSYEPESFTPEIVRADFERGQARVKGALTGKFAQKVEPSILTPQGIAGLGKEETIAYFKQFPSVGDVDVSFSPFWVQSIPSRSSATEITIKQQ